MPNRLTVIIPCCGIEIPSRDQIYKLNFEASHNTFIAYEPPNGELSLENKLIESKLILNNILRNITGKIIPNKNILMSVSQQDIQNSIYQCLKTYEEFDKKAISEISTNKLIINSLKSPISNISNFEINIYDANDELLKILNQNPYYLYQLSSRKFEEVIAEILFRKGYDIKLTSATRDGGKDIYAARKNDLGSFVYIVECKKYSPSIKVGVGILRSLYGVVSKENLTAGIIVTTSFFTKPAQEFQKELEPRMSLRDFNSVKQWIRDVT